MHTCVITLTLDGSESMNRLTIHVCTAMLSGVALASALATSSDAQVQSRQEQTRSDFSKYFEIQKKVAAAPAVPLGARRAAAAAAVKSAPGIDAQRSRLLKA